MRVTLSVMVLRSTGERVMGMEQIFGPTLNTIPFFHRLPAAASTGIAVEENDHSTASHTFAQYSKQVQQQLSEALEYGMYPLAEIIKLSTELLVQSSQSKFSSPAAHGNRLFNLIFDYQQNRWDFHLNASESLKVPIRFKKLLDRIGCPLSLRVLVNEKVSSIQLIATSECQEYSTDYLKNILHGFHEMILSTISLWKKETQHSLHPSHSDFTLEALQKEFHASYQVKQQRFSTIFPTVKGKSWVLPYVDFTLQCTRKVISAESMINTIFSMFCYTLTKHCMGCDFVGILFSKDMDPSSPIYTVPFDLQCNETIQEMIDRAEQLVNRHLLYNRNHSDFPLFLGPLPVSSSFSTAEEAAQAMMPELRKFPVVLQIMRLLDEGAQVRIYWHHEEIPLELRTIVMQCMQHWFMKWCANKNEVYKRPLHRLKEDVRNIKPYLRDKNYEDTYLHQPLLPLPAPGVEQFTVVSYGDSSEDRLVLTYPVIKQTVDRVATRLVKEIISKTEDKPFENVELDPLCNGVIAIVMEKGWEQVIACLSILKLGHAYLPMDAKSWSEHRIRQVLEISNAVAVITQSKYVDSAGGEWLKTCSIPVISINKEHLVLSPSEAEEEGFEQYQRFSLQSTDQLAYLIYTSGSTGLPKGVCCHHKGAMNTINDLNDTFSIGVADKVLGLSSLSFDLSVYDIFGMLACGGSRGAAIAQYGVSSRSCGVVRFGMWGRNHDLEYGAGVYGVDCESRGDSGQSSAGQSSVDFHVWRLDPDQSTVSHPCRE